MSLLRFFLMTLTRNTTNGMSKMTNKYIVEIQVTGTEIYEIESDVSLTEHELVYRAINKDKPDNWKTNGDSPYSISVMEGKLEIDESLK